MRSGIQALEQTVARDPMALVWPFVIFIVTLTAGWVASRLILRALHAWTARTHSRGAEILTEALQGSIVIWAVILAAHLAIQGSDLPITATDWGAKVLAALWIVSLTLVGMRIAGRLVRDYGDQVPGALPVTTLTETLAQLTVAILGILLLLGALGLRIAPILTALGVGGLAVALALQDTLANLFAGFYIAVARQLRIGDYIKLNTGEEGYVTDIGWRSTNMRALSNNMILVPNAKLAQANVTNYSLPDKRMSASVEVGVSYGNDLERIERVLLEIGKKGAAEIPGMLADPAPSVAFDPGFGEYTLRFTLGFQVAEFASQFGVRNELRRRIFRRFQEEGIAIPFPTRTIQLEGAKPGGDPA